MNFYDQQWLLALWLLPMVFAFIIFSFRKLSRRMQLFAKSRLSELLSKKFIPERLWARALLISLAVACLIFSLARPRLGYEWKDLPRGGIDLIIAVDLSTSMLATDIKPTRLERAKRELKDLVQMLEGDRIGIVAFAGNAFVQCPLTVDYRMARLFIDQLDVSLMPTQGTEIGEAIKIATQTLDKASEVDSQSKAIILITDGEDQGKQALFAAQEAKSKGIQIYAIGIGSDSGAPIPNPDGGFKKDKNGQVILTALDEKTLVDMTQITGGTYVRSTSGDFDLDHIYAKGIRAKLADNEYGESRQKIWYERFQWFLLLAFVLLFFDFLLPLYRKKKEIKSVITLLAILGGGNLLFPTEPAHANSASKGAKSFAEEEYKKAAEEFLKAEVAEPEKFEHAYNRAVSQFRNGDFAEAAAGFAKSSQSDDVQLKKKSLFNLGNSLVAQGQMEKAAEAFQQSLNVEKKYKKASENLEWVKKQIEKQKQEQKDQNKKDDQKNSDEQKDQRKQEQDKNKDQQNQEQEKNKDQQQDQQNQEQEKNKDQQQDQQNQDQNKNKDQQPDQQNQEQDKNKDQQQDQQNEDQEKNKNQQQAQENAAQDQENTQDQAQEQKALDRAAAQRLLRGLEEQEKVYGLPPKAKRGSKPEKDW